MAIAEQIVGSRYRFHDSFVVGREKVREFACAIKADHPAHHDGHVADELGYAGVVAPLTFIAVAGSRVQQDMFQRLDVGINLERVLHRDQKLRFHRPIVEGDELYFESHLDSVVQTHGTVIVDLRSEVTDAEGTRILTSVITIIGEALATEQTHAQVAAIASRVQRS